MISSYKDSLFIKILLEYTQREMIGFYEKASSIFHFFLHGKVHKPIWVFNLTTDYFRRWKPCQESYEHILVD